MPVNFWNDLMDLLVEQPTMMDLLRFQIIIYIYESNFGVVRLTR